MDGRTDGWMDATRRQGKKKEKEGIDFDGNLRVGT
jgi:hypothetical protein